MSRVAIVALLFPPIQQIGARRPLRLANQLAEQGHDVTVYAVHPASPQLANYARADAALAAGIDRRVRVVRTPSVHGVKILLSWRDRLRSLLRARPSDQPNGPGAPAPPAAPEAAPSPSGLKQLLDRLLNAFDVPDVFSGWILTTLPVVLFRSLLRRPDAIFVTAPPWSPLILAVTAGKILRVPVHVDFRDPWTLNPYVKAPRSSVRLEAWVVRNCASIIANTESMARGFREAYPDAAGRVTTIYNGYERETRTRVEALAASVDRTRRGPLVVAHIGTLYPARMPPSLARQLARVASEWPEARPIRFRFVGAVWDPVPLKEAFAERGVTDSLELVGEVTSTVALRETVAADVLLLLQVGTNQQVPAKIFECAFARNALVSVADPESETTSLIKAYQLGLALDGGARPEDLRIHLQKVCNGTIGPTCPGREFLASFDGEALAGRMAAVVLGGGSPGSIAA